MEIINHIEMRDGIAVIRGHGHLKAKMVARMHVWEGQSIEAVMEHYGLTPGEVHAAIAYYHDNREVLEAEYQRAIESVQDEALTLDKLKAKIKARQQGNTGGE